MNVFWWIALGCLAAVFICFIVAVSVPKYSDVGDNAGLLAVVALVLLVIFAILGAVEDDDRTKSEQKRELQKAGFSYVNVDYANAAVVSIPKYAKGCRLKIEKVDNSWVLVRPKDQTRSIVSAADTARWPSIVDWCGQPQPK